MVLGVVSFLNDMSSEMIIPLIPGYLLDVLKVKELTGGIIVGLIESLSSILKVLFGYLSDRFNQRKIFVALGYAVSTVSKAFLGFSRNWLEFILLRICDRIGKGIRTAPRDALIAESVNSGTGEAFGFHRMLDTFGAVAGPIIAVLLIILFGTFSLSDYKYLFLFSAIPGFLAVALVIMFVKEGRPKKLKKKISFSLPKRKEIVFFLGVVAVGTLGRYSYAFTLWKLKSSGYLLIESLLFYSFFNLIYAVGSYPFGLLSDVFGKKRVFAGGYLLGGLASLLFIFAVNKYLFIFAFLLYGLYTAVMDTVPVSFMAEIAGNEKGTAIGIYHFVSGIFLFPASAIAGFLWQSYSINAAFFLAAVFNIAAFSLLLSLVSDAKTISYS